MTVLLILVTIGTAYNAYIGNVAQTQLAARTEITRVLVDRAVRDETQLTPDEKRIIVNNWEAAGYGKLEDLGR